MSSNAISRNWVFLGDSLTEGVGSQRVSPVSELVKCLRNKSANVQAVHHMRLREVDGQGFDHFVRFNVAGFIDRDQPGDPALWIWNLGCEGRTINEDLEWLPFIGNLRPEWVVIFRGSLESIVRPAMITDGSWPWLVPNSWRSYSSLDPRCYYSSTWWRKAKQSSIDELKQITRRRLLERRAGMPLMKLESLTRNYHELLARLRELSTRVLVLGLLPVDDRMFPGSEAYFAQVTASLKELANNHNVHFLDWGAHLRSLPNYRNLFYRDGFHPNGEGAKVLATILEDYLGDVCA